MKILKNYMKHKNRIVHLKRLNILIGNLIEIITILEEKFQKIN